MRHNVDTPEPAEWAVHCNVTSDVTPPIASAGMDKVELSVSKHFKTRERVNTTFMVAIQNLFNHPSFATPAANISSPGTVGVITSTKGYLGARTIELRLRIQS